MSRDDEVEAIAMQTVPDYEHEQGYDIRNISPDQMKRYIEVKGRSGNNGKVMLLENEMTRLAQLGDSAWLYIVINCKSIPELFRIQNPIHKLTFQLKTKGVQYFLPMQEWKSKVGFEEHVH